MTAAGCARLGALALAGALLNSACVPALEDGQFVCDPAVDAPCPPGYRCLQRAGTSGHRCYREAGDYCGDGVAQPGEACDGQDLAGATCASLGRFRGRPRCTSTCELDPTPCRRLRTVSLAYEHGCGLDGDGVVWCWGGNGSAQLGDWTRRSAPEPVRVASDATYVAVAAGLGHGCALDAAGQAFCWGESVDAGTGSLGDPIYYPAPVVSNARFRRIASGRVQTCGLDMDGQMWCWGRGAAPALGQPGGLQVINLLVPTRAGFAGSFAELALGTNHGCALDEGGAAFCWGWNDFGQLGGGEDLSGTDATHLAVAVSGGHTFESLSASWLHTCALKASGELFCWGGDAPADGGELVPTATPRPVQPELRFDAVAAGTLETCGADVDGAVWCWRRFDDPPEPCLSGLVIRELWLGKETHTLCGRTEEGDVFCEGWNGAGLAGGLPPTAPRRMEAPRFAAMGAGWMHSCGLDDEGQAWCWGSDLFRQRGMGFGSIGPDTSPMEVAGGISFDALSVGGLHNCGLDGAGQVWCWGNGGSGALGQESGEATFIPVLAAAEPAFQQVSAGLGDYTCAVDEQGLAWCWGDNSSGQLGTGDLTSSAVPQPVLSPAGRAPIRFSAVSANVFTTCGLDADGAAWCWGDNTAGNCGDPEAGALVYRPVQVLGEHRFTQITTHYGGACALDEGGQAWCWGYGKEGQLGTGYTNYEPTPAPVAGGIVFDSIDAGSTHVCGLDETGGVWCWGMNIAGQLGDGTLVDRFAPVPVPLPSAVLEISTGLLHTCALDVQGDTWCWGANGMGQVGADDSIDTPRLLATSAE